MYAEILLPSDGSDAAAVATEHALNLAQRYDAQLHVLYVVDQSAVGGMMSESQLVASALEREGNEVVEAVAQLAGDHGVDVTTSVVTGHPSRTILDYAADHDVDLVVMGTHGRSGIDRYLLGSVTERVVRRADVPVLAVRETEYSASADRD
ncbi:Nucleotide-binding universal stress protein, UspA family [Halogranum gelatinilyticum]|uniref:Nucleotide-binding universal stress protein, UspA family n=1 Tax=Halogranum gelatinilyticum TaxID=660521 RepID=A0A1G9VJB7_9EURY|nr:universal stress protein [Halogranum gelatinilyticum]SDM72196.1 Nucleotide-binding universal stress protein, UspA family [Halogranum gelatinilyticum]